MINEMERERESPLVLVADDDLLLRHMARDALEQAGFAVEEAGNGLEAISAFQRLQPDVVLLDVMMPELDGFSACAHIRHLPGGDLTPILIVTGLDDLESIRRAYEVGATDFLAKPVNWGVLGHHVQYMLRASRAFSKLRQSEAKNQALLNAIPDLMFRISGDGIFLEAKESKGTGFYVDSRGVPGRSLNEVLPKDVAEKMAYHIQKAFRTNDTQLFEYELRMDDGTHHFEARIVVSGLDEVLAIIRDITERRKAEEQIIRLAYYDSLTGLPNLLLFKDRLAQAIAGAQRQQRKVAVMFLDLDRFKRINETLGHNFGDLLLQRVSDRLGTYVRSTDTVARIGGEEIKFTLARMGGDEFIILLSHINDVQHAAFVAQRLLNSLSHPLQVGAQEIYSTANIGISIYPIDSEDLETLLKYADTAVHQAKERGGNDFQFYTRSMNAAAVERFTIENQLRRALIRDEFQLYYQAQMDTHSRKVVGVEALVRWAHPEKGVVSPLSFIPLAEETGLIVPIGQWILQTACAQTRMWQTRGHSPITMSVNISSVQFRQSNFVDNLLRTLNEVGLDPKHLELELTESVVMENAPAAISTLHALKNSGIQLSIDDFGTGYSSLSYLKRFPIHTLKVDRSFVKDIDKDPGSAAIVKSIIALAQNLNLNVVAEGVETIQQMTILQECGCAQMQGYLFHTPSPAEGLLQAWPEQVPKNP